MMEHIEIFQVLGIQPTKDERAIKNAYREKLAVTNPEDNPEGFKRLRTAFEEACRLANQPDEETEAEEQDTTPSGLWMAKVAEVYGNVVSRRDIKAWEQLFEEDIFFSLEEEENCRLKLVRFLMDHYRLPTNVWKLLDEKLEIIQDRANLKEFFPADFLGYIASKCERGEDVDFTQFEGAPDAAYDLFIQYYEQCCRALDAGQTEQAAEFLKNADGLEIYHPIMEVCRAGLYEKQGRVQDAIDLMNAQKNRFPKDSIVCYNFAELLWRNERKPDAVAIYEEMKEENDSHYMANLRLTDWYYENKCYKEAKKCAEEVLRLGGDDDFVELLNKINVEIEHELEECYRRDKDWESALELCWCYLQDGKMNAGIRLAVSIEKQIPMEKKAEHNGLLAKLFVEEAEYEDSITMTECWEKSLYAKLETDESEEEREKDLDRLRQAHMIRVQCYRCLGMKEKSYLEKAIQEIESVETGSFKDIGLMLEKAQIYMEMEEYEQSLDITRRLVEDYQVYAAYATAMEVAVRQWDAGGVIRNGRACINAFPSYIRSYERMAKVYLDLDHKEELEQLLQEAKQNEIESPILDAYRYQMTNTSPDTEVLDARIKEFRENFLQKVENGEISFYESGLPTLTMYLNWYPGSYMLVERAIFHKAAHHLEEAKEDYEKALVEQPTNPYALNGLSFVYRYQGEYEKALVYLNRAILYMDEDMSPYIYTDLASLYSLLGDHERALAAYKIFAEKSGGKNQYQMKRLAMSMARCGDVDGAAQKIKEVLGDKIYDYYDTIVELYQITGRARQAEQILIEWSKKLRADTPVLGKLIPGRKRAPMSDFYLRRAWQELMYGDRNKVFRYFDNVIKEASSAGDKTGLCDAIFACILLDEPKRAKSYAAGLKRWLHNQQYSKQDQMYDMQKAKLQLEFLAAYYDESDEKLGEMLEREKDCEICHFCNYELCKEMESVRILYLIRIGKKEEAIERLERNLEKQPLDEYMIAIRNRIKR